MDCTVASISGKQFREGVAEVVANEGGDDVFISKGDHEEVAGSCRIEVVLPSGTRVSAWLWVSGRWSLILLVLL